MEDGVEGVDVVIHGGGLEVLHGPVRRDTDRSLERNRRTAFLAPFGGNQDHTVCSTRAVQGGSRSVLQDRDGFDITRVEGVHYVVGRIDVVAHLATVTRLGRDAVDDIERLIRRIHGTDTADADRSGRTGLTGTARNLHAGDLSVERLLERYGRNILDGFLLDHGSRTGVCSFLGGTVGDDDRLLQRFRIGREGCVNDAPSIYHHLQIVETDGGEYQDCIGRHVVEDVRAILIGCDTGHRALHHDAGERDGCPVLRRSHLAGDPALREQRTA